MWNKKVFQVAIPTYNSAEHIARCLDSVNESLSKEKWHLVISDNGSTDDTLNIIKDNIKNLSCQTHLIFEHPKAKNSAQAKNRVLSVCGSLSGERPGILGIDPTNIMLPDRVKLYDKAKEELKSFVTVGSWRFSTEEEYKNGQYACKIIKDCIQDFEFTWDCTLIHANLIPKSANFFDEDLDLYEDIPRWAKSGLIPPQVKYVVDTRLGDVNHKITGYDTKYLDDGVDTQKAIQKVWDTIEEIETQKKAINLEPPPPEGDNKK